ETEIGQVVPLVAHGVDERAQAEPERHHVEDRLRERRQELGLPVGEVDLEVPLPDTEGPQGDVAEDLAHLVQSRSALPVSFKKTSSRVARRMSRSWLGNRMSKSRSTWSDSS